MTDSNSFISPLIPITALLAVIMSGVFMGWDGIQNQIEQAENSLSVYPSIETVGVTLEGVTLSQNAQLMYRQTGEIIWHAGHSLVRIPDGRLVGSLFGFSPATSYDIKVINGATVTSGSVTTQPNEMSFH